MESYSSPSKRHNVIDERSAWELANPLTLVGGNRPYHVMSVLLAEHSNSRGILGFLTLRVQIISALSARNCVMK
jgi:hypothetical protein